MAPLPYRTIDADNHYYETRDAFTRHIEPAYAERTFRVRTDAAGRRPHEHRRPALRVQPGQVRPHERAGLLAREPARP